MTESNTSQPEPSQSEPSLSELISAHLAKCSHCQESAKPVGLGQVTGLCSEYWSIIQDFADREGEVNNIVAMDEYGNPAPRQASPSSHIRDMLP